MKRFIIILAIMLLPGATAYCQQATSINQPTKAELEASLKQVQIEKRYLELQVQEQNLQAALEKMKKDEPAKKPEAKK